jgi:hypothetical protein
MVFVGINWTGREHEVCTINQKDTELTRFHISPQPPGVLRPKKRARIAAT